MIFIDEATIENGCLEVAAGENRKGLLRGMEPLTEDDIRDMDFIPIPTRPGDMILFDAYTPHRSAPTRHLQPAAFITRPIIRLQRATTSINITLTSARIFHQI